MLKRLEYYWDEGEQIDISDLKIYWDTNKNQFRHKFTCCECDALLNCRCFEKLEITLMTIKEGCVCDNCGFEHTIEEDTSQDLLELLDNDRKRIISKKVINLLTDDEKIRILDSILIDHNTGFCIHDILEDMYCGDDRDDIIKSDIIELLTEDEKADHFYDAYDSLIDGDVCEI